MEVLWKIVLTVGLLGSCCEGSISCKNENGEDVDWFILYKQASCFEYVYLDSKDQNLKKNNKLINHQAGVLAHTLEPYFESSSGFIAYSDQPPPDRQAGTKFGHSKGVVMMDKDTVVWLLHSTPRFPFKKASNNFYPDTGKMYAQIFICVTLSSKDSGQIDQHLKGINAYEFDKHNAEILQKPTHDPPSQDFRSKGGQNFKRFVKKISDKAEEGDLYVTIAETLKSNLYIQTWHSKPEEIYTTKNNNNKFKLYNIKSVKTAVGEWSHGNDHSKWCVSENEDWTCIADSNREQSQFERPGGALCINSKPVADAFRELINKDSGTLKRPAPPLSITPSPHKKTKKV